LASQALHRYVKNPYTAHAEFDTDLFLDDVSHGVVFLDTLCTINMDKHPLKEQCDADKYGRRIGQEFTGLGDMWAMLGLEYGSNEALTFLDDLLFFKAKEEIQTSLRLAKERGCAPCLKSKTSRRKFLGQPYIRRLLDRVLPANAKALEENIMEYGLRNSAFNTVGPSGTVSIMADNCTSGIEPLFDIEYYRETRVEGSEKERIFHYPLLKYAGPELFNMSKEEIKKKYHYKEAHEIDYHTRLNVQSSVQYWTDSSVSSTVNLAENCTVNDIFNIYLEGHALGIKGLTVFRDGSKKGVLSKDGQSKTDEMSIDIEGYLEYMKNKLSRTQRAYRCMETWKGVKVYINIVIDDKERPIEVFTNIPWEAGLNIDGDFEQHKYNEHKSYWDAICRLTSLCLRTSMPLKYVVKQLQRSTTTMVDLPAILLRVLNRFLDTDKKTCEQIKNREVQGDMCPGCKEPGIVHRGGCEVCLLCGFSECG